MISVEIMRRYPIFAGLTHDQLKILAKYAKEQSVENGHFFFREGDNLDWFYIILEGAVAIFIELPDQEVEQSVAGQLTGKLETKEAIVSTVGSGDIFGWSGLVAPYVATAGAKAITDCRVVGFNSKELLKIFDEDTRFGYQMTHKAAQVIRDRLRDIRIESLAFVFD